MSGTTKSKSAPIIDLKLKNNRIKLKLIQQKSEEALLKTINFLSSGMRVHFDNFYQTVLNDNLPKFVFFMSNLEKENIILSNDNTSNTKRKLTPSELENIDKDILTRIVVHTQNQLDSAIKEFNLIYSVTTTKVMFEIKKDELIKKHLEDNPHEFWALFKFRIWIEILEDRKTILI